VGIGMLARATIAAILRIASSGMWPDVVILLARTNASRSLPPRLRPGRGPLDPRASDEREMWDQGMRRYARRTRCQRESEDHDSSVVAFPPTRRHVVGFSGAQPRGTAGDSTGEHQSGYAGRIHAA
jgi:hypothetical protein